LVTSANDHEIKNYLARRLQAKTVKIKKKKNSILFLFLFFSKTDYNQLNNEHEKLKRELELTQLVDLSIIFIKKNFEFFL
jgi:hypothetical protein